MIIHETSDYAGIIVPGAVLSGGGALARIRRQLVEENLLDMVIVVSANDGRIDCDSLAILLLNSSRSRDTVLFIDAAQDLSAIGAVRQDSNKRRRNASEPVVNPSLANPALGKPALDSAVQNCVAKILAVCVRSRPQPVSEQDLSSPVCYASDFNDPTTGIIVDNYAFAASRDMVRGNNYDLSVSRYL